MKKIYVAVFIFIKGDKVLVEKRHKENTLAGHLLFPGGTAEENEEIETALKREIQEELGVSITKFVELPDGEIPGVTGGVILKPFVITTWTGEIPEAVLDSGDELSWISNKVMLNSPIPPTKYIAEALERYLKNGSN